jgi:hypothetical protein
MMKMWRPIFLIIADSLPMTMMKRIKRMCNSHLIIKYTLPYSICDNHSYSELNWMKILIEKEKQMRMTPTMTKIT